MSVDLNAIEAVVNSEKNAGSFTELIQEFKKLGVEKYDYVVEAGLYRYHADGSFIDVQMNGKPKTIADRSFSTKIKKAVVQAQSGVISFEEFTALAGASGVVYWCTDLLAMRVDYIDQEGNMLLSEPIPEV